MKFRIELFPDLSRSQDLRHGCFVEDLHTTCKADAVVHGTALVSELEAELSEIIDLVEDVLLRSSFNESLEILESCLNDLIVLREASFGQLNFDFHSRHAPELMITSCTQFRGQPFGLQVGQ